jgi:predicted transcriptional regulator
VVNEFEERDLIRRSENGYTTTPAAEAILEKLLPFLDTMEGIQNLGNIIEWLPPPVRSLDFRHLRNADIVTPTDTNPTEPFDFVAQRFRRANEIRTLARTVPGRFRDIGHDLSVDGTVDVELVIQASWFDSLSSEPDQLKYWRDRAARNEVWTTDQDVPLTVHICDDSVIIWLSEDHEGKRVIQGVLASDNPVVLSWAESLYHEYRDEAKPLDRMILPDS